MYQECNGVLCIYEPSHRGRPAGRTHALQNTQYELHIDQFLGFEPSKFPFKGSVSSSIPCTYRLLIGLCLSPFSWPMKMVTTKANQEMTRARHAG